MGASLRNHVEFDNVFFDEPVDVFAIDVELVITVCIRAIVVALGAVEKVDSVVVDSVADEYTGVADGVVVDIHLDCSALGGKHVGEDGEVGGAGHKESFAITVENHRSGIFFIIGNETGSIHHEIAFKIDSGKNIFELEVFLIGAELGKIVFVGLGFGGKGFLNDTADGGFEIVSIDESD